jgi:hypothetical protein
MDEKTLWGIAYMVYILLVAPKYLIAAGEIEEHLKNPAPFDKLMWSWIIGFIGLIIFHQVGMGAIPSLIVSIVVFGASFLVIKFVKR